MMKHDLSTRLRSLNEEQLSAIYQQVFNNDAGQLVLEDLRHRCFAFVPTHEGKEPRDPVLIAENEGKRSVVVTIETLINPAPKPPAPPEPPKGESE